jgi:hypothetical protein
LLRRPGRKGPRPVAGTLSRPGEVVVTARQLLEFLEGLDERAQEWVDALIARVDHHDSYIIEVEEY